MGRTDAEAISRWAGTEGFTFRGEAEGFDTPDVRELDSFRKWDSACDHVVGEYRNRHFEMLEVTTYRRGSKHGPHFVDQSMLLLPDAATDIPDFEIIPLPRRQLGLGVFGMGGLKLAKDGAHRRTQELVDAFSKHYVIYAGGMFESVAGAVGKAEVPDLATVAEICKPSVLEFLIERPGLFIESQGNHLVIFFPGKVLATEERSTLLRTANDLLDVLEKAKHEQSPPGIAPESTTEVTRGKVFGIVGGGALGFFVGFCRVIPLVILVDRKFVMAVPVFTFFGLVIGALVGKKLASFL